jgi:ATP-binding cassette subfamily B protein
LPESWRSDAEARLEPGEPLLAWFEPDLDERLDYARGLVILTGRRVLAAEANGSAGPHWQSWPLRAEDALELEERGGVGTLELSCPTGRLAHWRYTAAHSAEAQRLVQRLAAWRADQAASEATVCPSCGTVVSAADGVCLACAPVAVTPSASALFRLARFARPRARLIALGFFLTLASTSAGLIPPYLTMPLLDRVLIPMQNGAPADFVLVRWYLAGLAGAALLAWLLDWGRLYVLARVSERVSADLRSHTYAHLQRLSLEFFGGKRTGDLMSRISNDTDRLCNFLSLNLVDFATDILMIIMTSVILLTIDPLLALAALCPFPLIVGMVQRVRGRLLRGYRQAGVA